MGEAQVAFDRYDTAASCVAWLEQAVLSDARGDELFELDTSPDGRFWLGKLACEASNRAKSGGDRIERLFPSEVGLRVRPAQQGPWQFSVRVSFRCWREGEHSWSKSDEVTTEVQVQVDPQPGRSAHGARQLDDVIRRATGEEHIEASIQVEVEPDRLAGPEMPSHLLTVTLLNSSPEHPSDRGLDSILYEASLAIASLDTRPFELPDLPDSFRYNRKIPAHGINCAVEASDDGVLRTADVATADKGRPEYWSSHVPAPDLSFARLATDPMPPLNELAAAHRAWGNQTWGAEALQRRAEAAGWEPDTLAAASAAADEFEREADRLAEGLAALETDPDLRRAFELANEAFVEATAHKGYDGWRPFQIGFVLANLSTLVGEHERDVADIVWFATGGGKTETYLGLVTTAAMLDRLTGKTTGITAWSRFPLRLLSLQQTQRFADAMAGAEIVRRRHDLGGDPFSVGFLVGQSSTPNRIKEDGEFDNPYDPAMPERYRRLSTCPFCHEPDLSMAFDIARWTLEHQCTNAECPWPEPALPFYVVDDEIYRFLPTVIVGTLDKVAAIGMQASSVALVGPPRGFCSEPGHGHTYAERKATPKGCLVDGCTRPRGELPMPRERYGPTLRLQDELHLLRDSLGAVDAHYEAMLDHIQGELGGKRAKVLGSSATLSGYEQQVDVLYRRRGRVFPVPGPSASEGFWSQETDRLARRHVALAPRGATLEFANDRLITVLQQQIRRLASDPDAVCGAIGVPVEAAGFLLDLFGTNVVYGNTIRDLDAVQRSIQTQIPVAPLNTAQLTGSVDLEQVSATLERLERPEDNFEDRVHLVTASSMMSHGVDVDRLNTMVMLGLPLTAAGFIQTTARVGRTWPGIVFVLHRMARERDAGVFRSFEAYVRQGDRFVEPVPITRRSTRVLEQTIPGLMQSRILLVHERRSAVPLTLITPLREFIERNELTVDTEFDALAGVLGIDGPLDERVRMRLREWLEAWFENLADPPQDARFPSDLAPWGGETMRSLRDVEQQAPVRETRRKANA